MWARLFLLVSLRAGFAVLGLQNPCCSPKGGLWLALLLSFSFLLGLDTLLFSQSCKKLGGCLEVFLKKKFKLFFKKVFTIYL